MPVFLKAAGIGGSIMVVIALVIVLLKTVISFIAFLTSAFKILIVVAFIALIVAIGLTVLRGLKNSRKHKE